MPGTIGPRRSRGATRKIRFVSAREFLDKVLWRVAELDGLIVGFNLPFDLSRLALGWSDARRHFRGGFSLQFWKFKDRKTGKQRPSWYRPLIRVKHLDSKRSFIRFTQPRAERDNRSRGAFLESHFLDLRMLAFALTSVGHTLESACEAFGVEHRKYKAKTHGIITDEYIDYNRRDVLATQELLLKLLEEFDRHPIRLDPCKAYSPAAISKAYLKAMGVIPPSKKFANVSKKLQGHAMTAYFGERAECRIRNLIVPVVYVDFLSMYPTVNTLMGLWPLLTARGLEVVDATAEAQTLLDSATLDGYFDRSFWRKLLFFARIEPDGDVLPVRAEYGESGGNLNIGVNPFTSKKPLWYAGPDLVASTLQSRKPPRIIEAFKLVPVGLQEGLQRTALRGVVPIEPASDDFFRVSVEQRQRFKSAPNLAAEERDRLVQSLKTIANSGSYGIFAEMNPEELEANERAQINVYGLDEPFACSSTAPENPGEFFFAPIAALIPAAARLMLTLLECCVREAGGTYAFCDTDSMAIVATRNGTHLEELGTKALSWAEVDEIIARFSKLNPYNFADDNDSILKIEDENFSDGERIQLHALCVSAKRYALFRQTHNGSLELRKCSEHGLGHLLNPIDPDSEQPTNRKRVPKWIECLWEMMIRRHLGENPNLPDWIDKPALSRVAATKPEIVRRLNHAQKRAPYADQVKPTNFVLAAHVKPMGHPEGVDPEQFQLIAPYSSDPRQWLKLKWIDRYSGKAFPITTLNGGSSQVARVKSYRDVFEEYTTHPEPKSAGPDGKACDRTTRGLLTRRHVYVASIYYVGKESNFLEEVEYGLLHDPDEVQQKYLDPREDAWARYVVPVLKLMPRAELARLANVTERFVQFLRNGGKRKPSRALRAKLTHAAADYARRQFGPNAPADKLAACAGYLSAKCCHKASEGGFGRLTN
jgi:DNA polymerase type B, organellar and viral